MSNKGTKDIWFQRGKDSLRAITGYSHAHFSCVEKQERLAGSRLSTIYDFGSIQFSNTLMSDGYFHIFLKDESNENVSEISIDPPSELIISVPNIDK